MKRQLALVFCTIALVGLFAQSASAADLTKLGTSTLMSDEGHEITIKNDAAVSALVVRVKNSQINLKGIAIAFADGTEKTIEVKQKLRPGIDSESIDLGTTASLTKVTLVIDTESWVASKRVPVTVYGS